ncbi:MAG: hypothetical protein MJZ50_02500 [Treponema sp.]|nr:hypothetical protein [Treponema sp.]
MIKICSKKAVAACLSLVLAASVFAQSSGKNGDGDGKAKKASSFSELSDEEKEKYYIRDSSGSIARDSQGNPVRTSGLYASDGTLIGAQFNWFSSVIDKNVIDVTKDDLRIVLNGNDGTFGIYAINEKGQEDPLLTIYDAYSSSFFTVKAGNQDYKLVHSDGIRTEARRTPLGAQMAYLVPEKFQTVIDFSFMPSIASSTKFDMLRITVYTINLGREIQEYSVKGIFDTYLGENTKAHFSTATKSAINSEFQFVSMSDDLWVRSSNNNTALQFMFESKGISKPAAVTLSGKDSLNSNSWVPAVRAGSSFNSVSSYNNSAVAVNWDKFYLDCFRTAAVSFYISVASDGNIPAGRGFLADLDNGTTYFGSAAQHEASSAFAPAPVPLTMKEIDESTPSMGVIDSEGMEPFVEHNYSRTFEKDYIRDLLEHIAALEEDESLIDQAELDVLNSELDSIIERLGLE